MCLEPETNKWNLVGIVSDTVDCNLDNTPGLATRISKYQSYITSLLETGRSIRNKSMKTHSN